jgi:hypothetical protein
MSVLAREPSSPSPPPPSPPLALVTAPQPDPDPGTDLDAAEAAAVAAVIAGDLAWSVWSDLVAAGHDPDRLRALVGRGYLEPWDRPEGLHVSLTPWAAWRLHLAIVEHWEFDHVEVPRDDGRRGPAAGPAPPVRVRAAYEVPRWAAAGVDERGDPVPPPRQVRLPRHAAERPLPFPERVPDRAPGPVEAYLMTEAVDPATGDPVRDPATGRPQQTPMTLWGRTIAIDRRLARGPA